MLIKGLVFFICLTCVHCGTLQLNRFDKIGLRVLFSDDELNPLDYPGCNLTTLDFHIEESQRITSPFYDESDQYPADALCTWRVFAPEGKVVRISFRTVDIMQSDRCGLDYLTIYDGDTIASDIVAKICGHWEYPGYPDVETSQNVASILFYSSIYKVDDRKGAGFELIATVADEIVPCTNEEFACENGNCIDADEECDGNDDCGDASDEAHCSAVIPEEPECGIQVIPSKPGNTRIVGGTEAVPGSWPWMIDMRVKRGGTSNRQHYCGGILIRTDMVLTAAQCFNTYSDPSMWSAHGGKHRKDLDDATEVVRYVERVVIHPDFNSATFDNDIALVWLTYPFTPNDYITTVCLPEQNQELTDNHGCYVTGWGVTLDTGNDNYLNQAFVPYISQPTCNGICYYNGRVTSNMVCAGYDDGYHDACTGDRGGPLSCKVQQKWTAVGINSWGHGCGQELKPGVYTKISKYINWIEGHNELQ